MQYSFFSEFVSDWLSQYFFAKIIAMNTRFRNITSIYFWKSNKLIISHSCQSFCNLKLLRFQTSPALDTCHSESNFPISKKLFSFCKKSNFLLNDFLKNRNRHLLAFLSSEFFFQNSFSLKFVTTHRDFFALVFLLLFFIQLLCKQEIR